VGNLTAVRSGQGAVPPSVTAVTPDRVPQGSVRDIRVQGSGLAGSRLQVPRAAELSAGGFNAKETEAGFKLRTGTATPLGSQVFGLSTALGAAQFSVLVEPVRLKVSPSPIWLAPGGAPGDLSINVLNPDATVNIVSLSIDAPSVASVSPDSLTFALGQVFASARITGLAKGVTNLRVSSSELGAVVIPVYVNPELLGTKQNYATRVGVLLDKPMFSAYPAAVPAARVGVDRPRVLAPGSGPVYAARVGLARDRVPLPASGSIYANRIGVLLDRQAMPGTWPQYAPRVGVALGPVATALLPATLSAGSSGELIVQGTRLSEVASAGVTPPDGVVLGALTVNAEGTELRFPITIAPAAAAGARTLRLFTGTGSAVPVFDPSAAVFSIVP
jgi:hypothetical protein